MTERLQKWTAFLVALASLLGALETARQGWRKAADDFAVVEILSRQLAEAQNKSCP